MQSYTAVGMMSGTSLDGIDLILANFNFDEKWEFKILKTETIEYSKNWTEILSKAPFLSGIELNYLHKEYGRYIGNTINSFLNNTSEKVDFIASHGHTIFHQPHKGLTLQIGDGNEIAAITGICSISDFRSLDVALGGQGAPLVPIGDECLFSEYDYCLNIGGFANISFSENNTRYAFDICPVNILLNYLANKLGLNMDKDGELGEQGAINKDLLQLLNKQEFYSKPYPKSLGKEWLETAILPTLNSVQISVIDQLATVYEHISDQISIAMDSRSDSKVLITGGGAYNKFLIQKLKQKTQKQIIIPDKNIVEFKEALIFAFLGLLRLQNKTNCLASVTGARKNNSGGIIHLV